MWPGAEVAGDARQAHCAVQFVCDVGEVGFAQGSTDEEVRLYNSLMAEETPLRIMPANLNPSLRKKYERSVAIWDGY